MVVAIDEPQDTDRVLEDAAPFEKEVVFLANESMTRLTVRTVDDEMTESNKTVTAVVLPLPPDSSVSPGDDEYYNASLTPASVLVLDDETTQMTITAVGTVGSSGLVEVAEGEEIVFELTRTGDLTSPLTARVEILGVGVVNIEERFIVFSAGVSTTQPAVRTFLDDDFRPHTTVTATVLPAAVAEGESGYYVVRSPASVLLLDDDIPRIRIRGSTTQVSITEGEAGVWPIILEADERPHLQRFQAILFLMARYDENASAGDIVVNLGGSSPLSDTRLGYASSIVGSNFKQVEGVWQWSLSDVDFTAGEDEQMEGDETLFLDLLPVSDPRFSIVDSLGRRDVDGEEVFPDAIITIVDNDFVTIAPAPDEHPDNPEVDEGEEIVFELTRPGDTASSLTVTVQIDEPQDANRVLDDTAPFTKTVVFSANEPTAQLTVRTADDAITKPDTTVTAVVLPLPSASLVSPGDDEYYNAASTPASVVVFDDETMRVSITAVGAVGDSLLVEVDEDDEIVFELTRTGDPSTELVVLVDIFDDGEVLADDEGSRVVMFPAGVSTTQLAVPTFSDLEFEPHTTVTATVVGNPLNVAEGDPGYYAPGSPRSASVLVRDDDIPEMQMYVATTQVRISEGGPGRRAFHVIFEADERPHNDLDETFALLAYDILLEKESVSAASADDASLKDGDVSVSLFTTSNIRLKISGSAFNPVGSRLQWRLAVGFFSQFSRFRLIAEEDEQMEGDETLLIDVLSGSRDPRISLINSLPEVEIASGTKVFPEAIITIVDNDFVTIALDPDEHPDNPEVAEGEEIVFELTRPGDLTSELTVTVAIDEPQDTDRVLEDTAPFEKTVMFRAGEPTAQLTVPTVDDTIVESNTTVTAVVLPLPPDSSVSPGDDEYYNASPTPASVLVLADETMLVSITAVGTVGSSGLVEVLEGDEIVFELTRAGDPAMELTVTVAIAGTVKMPIAYLMRVSSSRRLVCLRYFRRACQRCN